MKYPDGSAVRGFSLGATAGSKKNHHAPSCTIFLSVVSANLEVSFHGLSFVLDSKRVHGRWSYSWEMLGVRKARQKQIRYTSRIRNEQLFSLFFPSCCTNLCIRDEHVLGRTCIRSRPCKPTSSFSLPCFCACADCAILPAMTCHDHNEEPWRGICGARRSRLN